MHQLLRCKTLSLVFILYYFRITFVLLSYYLKGNFGCIAPCILKIQKVHSFFGCVPLFNSHLPMCGVRTTLLQAASGWLLLSGSGVITSSPAPPSFPACNQHCNEATLVTTVTWSASTKASWSTSPPLEVFTIQADGFIFPNRLRDTMPSVVGFKLAHLGFGQVKGAAYEGGAPPQYVDNPSHKKQV